MRALLLPAITAVLLTGCATVDTRLASTGGEGIEYALPTSEFVLELREGDGYIAATLVGPVVRQDNTHRYRTKLLSSGIATNEFTIEVNNRGLLTSLTGSSDGKLTEIAKQVARTIAYQSAEGSQGTLFFATTFKLSEIADAEQQANAAIAQHVAAICAEKTDKGADAASCKRLRSTLARSRGPFLTLATTPIGVTAAANDPNPRPVQPRSNSVLYYRPLISVRMTVRLGDGFGETKTFAIPDDTRVNWISLPGGVFAKQEYELTFQDGVLTKYHRIARNEVVGAVGLPVEVAKSLIAAPFEGLNDRKAGLDAQTQYLNSAAALQTAAANAEKACADARSICQDLPIQSLQVSNAVAKAEAPPTQRVPNSGGSNGTGSNSDEGT